MPGAIQHHRLSRRTVSPDARSGRLTSPPSRPLHPFAQEIPLSNGLVALVDAEDFDWLSQWTWRAMRASTKEEKWYAVRSVNFGEKKIGTVYMHREILKKAGRNDVDHRDRNGLNNQRENLRPATRSQNIRAKNCPVGVSGFRGVRPTKDGNRWVAAFRLPITPDGHRPSVSLGSFASPEDAARAYDRAAVAHFGEFARLNFPDEVEA